MDGGGKTPQYYNEKKKPSAYRVKCQFIRDKEIALTIVNHIDSWINTKEAFSLRICEKHA